MKKESLYCRNCGTPLTEETDKDLKQTYPLVCLKCDENMFTFEAVSDPSLSRKGTFQTEQHSFTENDLTIKGSEHALRMVIETIRGFENGLITECPNQLGDLIYQMERQFGIVDSGENNGKN
jgi:hypothetical protein